jgi:hypothetical protein
VSDGIQESQHGVRDRPAIDPPSDTVAYELCNVFGTPTGRRIVLRQGEAIPATPKGWYWLQLTS